MPRVIDHTKLPKAEQLSAPLSDLLEWLGADRYLIAAGHAAACRTARDVQTLNFALGMAGVSGAPFFMLCREHCPAALELWMSDSAYGNGEDAAETVEQETEQQATSEELS